MLSHTKFMKSFKKGIVLLELVISMAVSSVVFVGISGLLIFLNTQTTFLKNGAREFYNANALAHSIELILDEGNSNLSNLPPENESYVYEDELENEISNLDSSTTKLFSVVGEEGTINYYFYKQHFGYTTGESLSFNNIYTSESKVRLTFSNVDENEYSILIDYGNNFENHFTIIKNLFLGVTYE